MCINTTNALLVHVVSTQHVKRRSPGLAFRYTYETLFTLLVLLGQASCILILFSAFIQNGNATRWWPSTETFATPSDPNLRRTKTSPRRLHVEQQPWQWNTELHTCVTVILRINKLLFWGCDYEPLFWRWMNFYLVNEFLSINWSFWGLMNCYF